jgi:HK97 family phage prohead protease
MIRFTAPSVNIDAAASDGTPSRTISGIAVPYGVPATVSDGTEVIFEEGSLPIEGKKPRLYMNHDANQAIGIVTERVDTEEGMMFTAKISKTAAGDEALQLALDGVLDSVSVGVNPTKTRANKDGSITVLAADWIELSMVPVPAFAGAVITDIAASIHHEPEETDNNEIQEPTEETEPMSEVETPAVEATIPTAAIPAQPKREFKLPNAGEFMAAYHIGGDTFANMNKAVAEFSATQRTALQAAAGDVLNF